MREVIGEFIFNDAPTNDDLAEAAAEDKLLVVMVSSGVDIAAMLLSGKMQPSSRCIVYEYKFFGVDNYEDAKKEFLRRINVMTSDACKEWYPPAGGARGVLPTERP